ncbi:MAG: hypothetical protein LBF22_13805 [Deltaproteobacteria bacterium]|nr:hypothetical protein [Deltaproteobacteria bacterium]
MIKKILIILLLFTFAFISAVILFLFAWFKGWSPYLALLGPLVFLGLPLLWFIFSTIFSFFAKKRFKHKILEEEESFVAKPTTFNVLKQDWRHGIVSFEGKSKQALKLPWVLLLGPRGSGKSLAVRESGLLGSFDVDKRTQISNPEKRTQGMDWYFLDNCVCLDVHGLYRETPRLNNFEAATTEGTFNPHEGDNELELETLVELLEGANKKVPLQGAVVTIPADLLKLERERELVDLGMETRKILDKLSVGLDITFPVFILLTCFENYPNLLAIFQSLEAQGHPVGILCDPKVQGNPGARVSAQMREEAMGALVNVLGETPTHILPFLTGPREMEALERPLTVYMDVLGRNSPYAPTPHIKGVFFARPQPRGVENTLETKVAVKPSPASFGERKEGKSFFLEEFSAGLASFFGKIVPQHAFQARRLNLVEGKRQKSYYIGLSLFYLALILVGGLILANVIYQKKMSEAVEYLHSSQLRVALSRPLKEAALDRADAAQYLKTNLENIRDSIWVRGIGPDPAQNYLQRLEDSFLNDFDATNQLVIQSLRNQLTSDHSYESQSFAITLRQLLWLYSVWTMDLSKEEDEFHSLAQSFPMLPAGFNGQSRQYWNLSYARLLLDYIEAQKKAPQFFRNQTPEIIELREVIAESMSYSDNFSLDWIITWASYLPEYEPISLVKFWTYYDQTVDISKILTPEERREVPVAYTAKAWDAIGHVISQLEEVFVDDKSESFHIAAHNFKEKYESDYLLVWKEYLNSFTKVAINILENSSVDDYYNQRNVGGVSPFTRIVEIAIDNLSPIFNQNTTDPWLLNLELDHAVIRWSKMKGDFVGDTRNTTLNRLATLSYTAHALKAEAHTLYYRREFADRIYSAEIHLSEVVETIFEITNLLHNNHTLSHSLAAYHFSPGKQDIPQLEAKGATPTSTATAAPQSNSPFIRLNSELDLYASYLYRNPGDNFVDDLIYSIRSSTARRLETLLINLAAQRLNNDWENQVVIPTRYLSDEDTQKAIYGESGLLVKFLTGPAAPFIHSQGTMNYSPNDWNGMVFPFTSDFLNLISHWSGFSSNDSTSGNYPVSLTLLATTVDPDAKERPQKTTLTLRAADQVQSLVNYNFPSTQTFLWKPGTDYDASLEIDLPSLTLYVSYQGDKSFPSFLNDLIKGNFVLTPNDFPDHAEQLQSLGITELRILMQADGMLPVIRFLNLSSTPIPTTIAKVF